MRKAIGRMIWKCLWKSTDRGHPLTFTEFVENHYSNTMDIGKLERKASALEQPKKKPRVRRGKP